MAFSDEDRLEGRQLRARKLFVNLPVRDLQQSIAFFSELGFTFEPRFTDETATCMIIGSDCYAMLLIESRFKDFARKDLCDARRLTEGIFAITAASREEVDDLVETALRTGGTVAAPTSDMGFMYVRSFYDPDGHHWEIFFMDPAAQPKQ